MARGDLERGYARSRERNEALRDRLEPFGPGERPLALKLSAALAAVVALANLVGLASGATVDGRRPVAAALLLTLLMAVFAVALWQRRYLAVLAWEALLAVTIVWAALSLMVASNLAAVLVCVVLIGIAGPLFWLLIRVMARIQAPPR
jgi:hypothetical protein